MRLPILQTHLDILCFSAETGASEALAPMDTGCSSHMEVFEIHVLDSAIALDSEIVLCSKNTYYSSLWLLWKLNVEGPFALIFQKGLGLLIGAVILHLKTQLVPYNPHRRDLSPRGGKDLVPRRVGGGGTPAPLRAGWLEVTSQISDALQYEVEQRLTRTNFMLHKL